MPRTKKVVADRTAEEVESGEIAIFWDTINEVESKMKWMSRFSADEFTTSERKDMVSAADKFYKVMAKAVSRVSGESTE